MPIINERNIRSFIRKKPQIVMLAFSSVFILQEFKRTNPTSFAKEAVVTEVFDEKTIFDQMDKASVKIVSTGEMGSGFIFDLDEEKNKLYVGTNHHVIDMFDNEGTGYIRLYPKQHLEEERLPQLLCGKVAYTHFFGNQSNKNVDFAILEVEKASRGTTCTEQNMYKYDFVQNQDKFKALTIPSNDYEMEYRKEKNDNFYYTVGYPIGEYRRDKFKYDSVYNASSFVIDNITWTYRHINYNYDVLVGASGSPIVDRHYNVVTVLATNAGGVAYNSVNTVVDGFCKNNKQINVKHCK